MARAHGEERQTLDLADAAKALLDECRTVLPGIQALFGFQLISVFNQRFAEMGAREQHLHLAAIALVAFAVGMVMTPAAYHRSRGSRVVTDTFIHVSSLLLLGSMIPLAAAGAFAGCVFVVLTLLWLVFPRMGGLHRAMARARERATGEP